MTTRIPINTDDRSLGSAEHAETQFAFVVSGAVAGCVGIGLIWEPLWSGNVQNLPLTLIQGLAVSALVFAFTAWLIIRLTIWDLHGRISVHLDPVQKTLVVQTTRPFGYRDIVSISQSDVQSVTVRTHRDVEDPSEVLGHTVEATCTGMRHPVRIATRGPAELPEAEAITRRLRDALSAADCGFPQGETPRARD